MNTSITAGATATLKVLKGHLPNLPNGVIPVGHLPATNVLHLAIGLTLPDQKGLDDFLQQLYDPTSSSYRHYLTPDEFARQFGPAEDNYRAVMAFARTNGLAVTATYSNHLLLDVQGPVSAIERAFHIQLLTFKHPTENRFFFAPDTEPSVETSLPIADVSGLNNYTLPRPKRLKREPNNATPRVGSAFNGAYLGNDFRAAYLPGVTLAGAGQMLGLLEFDGFYASDIAAYETTAGIGSVPLQPVLLDGYDGTPTTGPNSGNDEVSLDIEMALAMAPGLSKIVVFEAGPNGLANDILNSMAANSQIKQFACSWGWGGGPSTTTDNIFKLMAAQGQSFFTASGDSDAYTSGASSVNGVDNTSLQNAPSSCPFITVVGGTTLATTGPGGAWASETVWNWGLNNGNYVGSSGGISSYYALPTWQAGISMAANGGSTTQRNIPDVALVADNIYVTYGNGLNEVLGGTSCAAPLWAGLTALINQQATGAGKPTVGFLNPAIYALGKAPLATSAFHDVATGNNVSGDSPNLFYATPGYDLCTGWGTPASTALIDALSGVTNPFSVLPASGLISVGPAGGPFTPTSQALILTNSGTSPVTWSLVNTAAWVRASASSGTLASRSATPLVLTLDPSASALPPATYNGSLLLTNYSGGSVILPAALSVGQSLVQNGGFETGDFTGWTLVGNTTAQGTIYNAVQNSSSGFTVVHSGSYGAFLGDTQLAALSQTLSTVPGQYYLLSLWLDNPASGSGQQFILNWNTNGVNNPLFRIASPPAFSWTNLHFLLPATAASTTLEIQAENDSSYFGVDDVSVTPVPLPVFQTAAKSGASLRLGFITQAGLVYQVQYKTNLLQANWLNLTPPVLATNYSLSVLDPNVLSLSPSRFYRLSVAP